MEVIVGIDEVGRGCWAGPLVAGAVVLSDPIEGLRDSKKLSKKRREQLAATVEVEALDYGLGWVSPDELDQVGLTKAVELAMRRALNGIRVNYQKVIIDGNHNYLPDVEFTECLIKADDLVPAVSAASILAKVARDNYMADMSTQYPEYGFDKHVGYGTAQHIKALKEYGVCDIHRKSFAPIRSLTGGGA